MKLRKKKKGQLAGFTLGTDIALLKINKDRAKARPVALMYTEEEAALLYDLLSSEMDELMSLNAKNRLSEEPIFDQEQTEYLHRVMQFCAEQMKVLSKYVPVGGANDAT